MIKMKCCLWLVAAILAVEVILSSKCVEAVECVSNSGGGTCSRGNVDCDQNVCDQKDPVQDVESKTKDDLLDNCKNRITGNKYAQKPNSGINEPFFTPYEYDPYYFQLHLSWEAWPNAEGYHVSINVIPQDDESEPPPKMYTYKCIEDGDAVSTIMFMEYSYPLSYSSCEKDREFEIQILGLPTYGDPSPYYRKMTWPNNCFSISNESHCGPHTPQILESSISIQTKLLPNSTSEMSATVQWDKPYNTMFDATLYQVLLLSSMNIENMIKFVINGTRSIVISPLDTEAMYYIYVEPFQKTVCQHECRSDKAAIRRNCGELKTASFSYIPLPSPTPSASQIHSLSVLSSLPSTPVHSSVPSPAASSSSHLDSPSLVSISLSSPSISSSSNISSHQASSEQSYIHYYQLVVGFAAVLLLVLVVTVVIVSVVVIMKAKRVRPHPLNQIEDPCKLSSDSSSDCNSVPSTRSTTPSFSPTPLISPSFNDIRFVYPEYTPNQGTQPVYQRSNVPNLRVVLVVESIRLSDEDSDTNLAFLGEYLSQSGPFHVLHYNKASRETPAAWVMRNIEQSDVVLCVCTKEFKEEWDGIKKDESPVHALRQHVVGYINTGRLLSDKFIVVTHNDKQKDFIPRAFDSVRKCFISETTKIVSLITQTPERVVS